MIKKFTLNSIAFFIFTTSYSNAELISFKEFRLNRQQINQIIETTLQLETESYLSYWLRFYSKKGVYECRRVEAPKHRGVLKLTPDYFTWTEVYPKNRKMKVNANFFISHKKIAGIFPTESSFYAYLSSFSKKIIEFQYESNELSFLDHELNASRKYKCKSI